MLDPGPTYEPGFSAFQVIGKGGAISTIAFHEVLDTAVHLHPHGTL